MQLAAKQAILDVCRGYSDLERHFKGSVPNSKYLYIPVTITGNITGVANCNNGMSQGFTVQLTNLEYTVPPVALEAPAPIKDFLNDLTQVIRATNFELCQIQKPDWVLDREETIVWIGDAGDLPIAIAFRTAIINKFRVLFFQPHGRFTDSELIHNWFVRNVKDFSSIRDASHVWNFGI